MITIKYLWNEILIVVVFKPIQYSYHRCCSITASQSPPSPKIYLSIKWKCTLKKVGYEMPAVNCLCLCLGVRAACRATSSTRVSPPPCLSSWPTCGSGWQTCGPPTTPTATPEDRGMKSDCPAVDWVGGSGEERHHCCFLPDWTCITFQPREETYGFQRRRPSSSVNITGFVLVFFALSPPLIPHFTDRWGGVGVDVEDILV